MTDGEDIMAPKPRLAWFPVRNRKEIIDNPTADNGVKCHQSDIPCQTEPAEDAPFLSGLFSFLYMKRGLACAALPMENSRTSAGDPQKNQTENIDRA